MAKVYIWSGTSGGQAALEGPFDETSIPQTSLAQVATREAKILQEGELTPFEVRLFQDNATDGYLEQDTSDPVEVLLLGDQAGIARPAGLQDWDADLDDPEDLEDFMDSEDEAWDEYYRNVTVRFPHVMCFSFQE